MKIRSPRHFTLFVKKSLWVRPTAAIQACADPDDDIFLECAHAARADFVVTGNIKDFPTSWLNTRIITARRFLEFSSEAEHSDS
jgi:predicted nucleic acid-binding protein